MAPKQNRPAAAAGAQGSPNLEKMLQTLMNKVDTQTTKVDAIATDVAQQKVEIEKLKGQPPSASTAAPTPQSTAAKEKEKKEKEQAQADAVGSTRKDLTEALGWTPANPKKEQKQ